MRGWGGLHNGKGKKEECRVTREISMVSRENNINNQHLLRATGFIFISFNPHNKPMLS